MAATKKATETKPAARAAGKGRPGVAKAPAIDLTQPKARDQLKALYRAPTNDLYLDATPEAEDAAATYFRERDAEKAAKTTKEQAGTVLCSLIGKNLGVRGDGWTATWNSKDGEIDWRALAKAKGISDEEIEAFRRPKSRSLDVRESAVKDAE